MPITLSYLSPKFYNTIVQMVKHKDYLSILHFPPDLPQDPLLFMLFQILYYGFFCSLPLSLLPSLPLILFITEIFAVINYAVILHIFSV